MSPREAKGGWYFVTYSGKASGFTFYGNKYVVNDRLEKIKNKGCKNFSIEYIDISDIPEGKIIR